MKAGLAARLAVVLALVGALAAGLTGYYVYRDSKELMLQSATAELLTSTESIVRRLSSVRELTTRNLQILAQHPDALQSLQQPQGHSPRRLARLFRLLMEAHPAYDQIRLIAAREHGLEWVRLDRDQTGIVDVDGDELQEKGHFAYVSEAMKLSAGQTYVSRVAINHERGSHRSEGKPSVVMSMPVVDAAGAVWGVVVINQDLEDLFRTLKVDLPAGSSLILANGSGDILIHPDESLTFGFDRGQRQFIQEHMPPVADLVQGRSEMALFEWSQGEYAQAPVVAAFLSRGLKVTYEDSRLVLGLIQPVSNVLQDVETLRWKIVRIVVVLCLGALVVAVVLARALARPIDAVTRAARSFAGGEVGSELPLTRQDEIGELARSFHRMQEQITQQMQALEQSRLELAQLAQHDGLTGLANRRLFEERMLAALARRRRQGGEVGLLFIDLDEFKSINDRYGHETGDVVLKAVAQRLLKHTREVDTAARLGGDEFVVLVDSCGENRQLEALAAKLKESIRQPIEHQGLSLQLEASIGIARTPLHGDTLDQLLGAADDAMYQAKAMGRHR